MDDGWMDGRMEHSLIRSYTKQSAEALSTHFVLRCPSSVAPRVTHKRKPKSSGELRTDAYFLVLRRCVLQDLELGPFVRGAHR